MLTDAILTAFPQHIVALQSLTTRPRRGPQDDAFFEFVSPEDIQKRQEHGDLLQLSEYAGHFYANAKDMLDAQLRETHVIAPLVEHAVLSFQKAGYRMILIQVIPQSIYDTRQEIRRIADEERAETPIKFDTQIINDFSPGGKENAIKETLECIAKRI